MEHKIKTQRIGSKLVREHFYCTPELSDKIDTVSKKASKKYPKGRSKSLTIVQALEQGL